MAELVRTVGRYGIIREVGRGGMAVVHLARQLDLDRLVALKELAAFHTSDPDFARRFVRESRLAGSLMHPNIVTVFDFFEDSGTPYIAMEYLDQGSLRPHVGRLSPAQIGGVLEGLLGGLAAAEQRGIVHRDLKPENLMVTPDGGIKIADFGIAKATTQASQTGEFATATGTTVGTPPYMAPEQAMGKDIGPWTDIYSVGCIAYELYTGRPPFSDAENPMAIVMRQINEPLPPASQVAGVDPEISEWIARLTAKDASKRPPSATDAWEDFEELMIALLGPRWRRDARLGEAAPRVPGPATPPPTSTPGPVEGIDVEGTGPDTGGDMPTADAPVFETYVPRTTLRPPTSEPAEPPAAAAAPPPQPPSPPPPRDPMDEETRPHEPTPAPRPPRPRTTTAMAMPGRADRLALAGAAGMAVAVLIGIVAGGDDRWNLFAAFSPLEAAGAGLAVWAVAAALRDGRLPVPFAAGVLLGLGAVTSAGAIALVKFSFERLGAVPSVLSLVVLAAAVAILLAGVACLRASPAQPATDDPATLVLGLAGAAVMGVALFVHYDGLSSLWSEVPEGTSAEFFLEPLVLVATAVVALVVLLGTRPQVAAGMLVAVGGAGVLHFLGVLVAAWRAIGEVGEVGPAGFIGLLGALVVLGAGAHARRRAGAG